MTVDQAVAVDALGDLVFTPGANGNGDAYASFTFKVSDGGFAERGVHGDGERDGGERRGDGQARHLRYGAGGADADGRSR